jgi:predicted DCC family thiol-disulfide oxidoreductase YuxK
MKTLKNHVILYDSDCPMCNVYTRAFTNLGMLDAEGRAPYQDMSAFACNIVDRERAVNEIALVDKSTGEVSYGVDSLFKVIAHSFPVFSRMFSLKPFIWTMRKLYGFISYNRRVIIPAPKLSSETLSPAFHLRYRLAYLLLTLLIAGCILTKFAGLFAGVLPPGNGYREYLICGGQIVFQGIIISRYAPKKTWDYLGNMMTISLAGSLLLLPGIAIAAFVHLPPIIVAGYFLFVAGLMLLEHLRRTRLLSLGWGLTASWVLYRVLVLLLLSRLG